VSEVAAVVMPAPGRALETRRFASPKAKIGGAVLETIASEVCGTDVHLHHGRLSGVPYPIIPGHVLVIPKQHAANGSVWLRSRCLA